MRTKLEKLRFAGSHRNHSNFAATKKRINFYKSILIIPTKTNIEFNPGHWIALHIRILFIKEVIYLATQGEGAMLFIFIHAPGTSEIGDC